MFLLNRVWVIAKNGYSLSDSEIRYIYDLILIDIKEGTFQVHLILLFD